ncbi:MAG: DUF2628 domain-containing protein [Pseudomonadota bacterium]
MTYGALLDAPVEPMRIHYHQDLYARWQAGERIIWNWAAFFCGLVGLGGVWMIYRRLYLLSFVYHLITIFLFSTCVYFFSQHLADQFKLAIFCINLALAVLSGLFANTIQLTWLAAWKQRFSKHKIPRGGDMGTVFAYFSIILISLGNVQGKFSAMLTVMLFSLFVLAHYVYYEHEL